MRCKLTTALVLGVLGVLCGFVDQYRKSTAEDAEDAEDAFPGLHGLRPYEIG